MQYVSLPLMECLVVPGTLPLYRAAVLLPTQLEDKPAQTLSENNRPLPVPKRVVALSLATLERAVSTMILFQESLFSSTSSSNFSGATTARYGKGYAEHGIVRVPEGGSM